MRTFVLLATLVALTSSMFHIPRATLREVWGEEYEEDPFEAPVDTDKSDVAKEDDSVSTEEKSCDVGHYFNAAAGACKLCSACQPGEYVLTSCGDNADNVCSSCANPERTNIDYWKTCHKRIIEESIEEDDPNSVEVARMLRTKSKYWQEVVAMLRGSRDGKKEEIKTNDLEIKEAQEEMTPPRVEEIDDDDEEDSSLSLEEIEKPKINLIDDVEQESSSSSEAEEGDEPRAVVRNYLVKTMGIEINPFDTEEQKERSMFAAVEQRLQELENMRDEDDDEDDVLEVEPRVEEPSVDRRTVYSEEAEMNSEERERDQRIIESIQREMVVEDEPLPPYVIRPRRIGKKNERTVKLVLVGLDEDEDNMIKDQLEYSYSGVRLMQGLAFIFFLFTMIFVSFCCCLLPLIRRRRMALALRKPMSVEQQKIINRSYSRLVDDKNSAFVACQPTDV